MIKQLLVLGIALGLGACARHQAEEAEQRRLLALDAYFRQANADAAKQNDQRLRMLYGRAQGARLSLQCSLIKRSDSLHNATKALVEQVAATRQQLRPRTLGQSGSSAALAMLGRQQDGLAYPLLRKIATYRAALHALDTTVAPLRLVPRQLVPVETPAAVAEFYFQDATLAGALVSLSQLEAAILMHEAAALQAQDLRLACGGNIVFDKVGAMAVAESNVVAAGTEYRAELFLTSGLRPTGVQMLANGRPIPVDAAGRGHVRFVANPRWLGTGKSGQAYWEGRIRVNSPISATGDTTYRVRVPYRVSSSRE